MSKLPNEQIIEGNKLIAEFMGWKEDYKPEFAPRSFGPFCYRTEDGRNMGIWSNYKETLPSYLEYHTSWDWLMPVVEKIEDIEAIGAQAYIDISAFKITAYCSGHLEKGLEVFRYKSEGSKYSGSKKIECVWQAVVSFIQWYNENQKAPM